MATGTVKWFNDAKGFGFIVVDGKGSDVFVHHSSIRTEGFRTLAEGQRVEFDLTQGPKGLNASNVRPLQAPVQTNGSVAVLPPAPSVPASSAPASQRAPTPDKAKPQPSKVKLQETVPLATALLLAASFNVKNLDEADRQSVFAMGRRLLDTEAFAKAMRAAFLPQADGRAAAPGLLVQALAGAMREQGAAQDPLLSQHLGQIIPTVIEPLARLLMGKLPESEYRNGCAQLTQSIRKVLGAGPANGIPASAPVASQKAPVKGEHELAQGVKPVVQVLAVEAASGRTTSAEQETGVEKDREGRSLVEQLALHLRAVLTPELELVRAALQRFDKATRAWQQAPLGPGENHEFGLAAQELAERLAPVAGRFVPREETLRRNKLLEDVEQALGLVDSPLPTPLLVTLCQPAGVELILRGLQLLARFEALSMPDWVWPSGSRSSRTDQVVRLFKQPSLLEELHACATWAESLPQEHRAFIPDCQNLSGRGSLVEQLQEGLDEVISRLRENDRRHQLLAVLNEFLDPTLLDMLKTGRDEEGMRLLERAEAIVSRMTVLRPGLHPDLYTDLLREVRSLPDSLEESLGALQRAVSVLGPEMARAISQRSALLSMAERLSGVSLQQKPVQFEQSAVKSFVRLGHPLSRREGGASPTYAADLVWSQAPNLPYGRVSFPIRLTFVEKVVHQMEVQLETAGEILSGVPSEWFEEPLNRTFTVSPGTQYLDLEISLPLAQGRAERIESENRNIELRFTVRTLDACYEQNCSWQGLRLHMPEYTPPFPLTVDSKLMHANPLGVEKRFQELLGLVRDGERSFLVAGPRRFGKTTLVKVLVEHAHALKGIHVLRNVVASAKPDAASVWLDIARQLQETFKRPVNSVLVDGLLPSDNAFDDVRSEAASRGIKSVYFLIDEAQALFVASGQPHMLGEALKQRLENAWGQRSEDRAGIRIGLIGQAHLPELMGNNLLGAFPSSFVEDRITPDDLLPILRDARTGGALQSTAEARTRLAELAGNLWILDKLLAEVWKGCQRRGRSWFIEDDVERAARSLVEADRNGTDETLWSYIRDVLNDSDDLKVWRPSETYPVAMAWAHLRRKQGTRLGPDVGAILPVLEGWATGMTLLKERVEEALQQLQKQKVLRKDGGGFQIPMLERLLAVRAEAPAPLAEDAEREVLTRLGLRRVKRPTPTNAFPASTGGQARTYQGRWSDTEVATRCVRLDTSKAHERFLREVRLLERLDATSSELAPRARAFLPKVRAAGLDDADPTCGVVLYDWIVGLPLGEKSLSEIGAVFVAECLVEALRFLEHASVIHRDIQPQNILIRKATGEPVLIDFGLSQGTEDALRSSHSLAGVAPYLPPEVLKNGAQCWTLKGDIYSLGRTLVQCLSEEVRSEKLMRLFERMCANTPEGRPSASELARELRVLSDDLSLGQRRDSVLQQFDNLVADLPSHTRRATLVSRGDYWACKVGTIAAKELRLCTVASFLENVLQAQLRSTHPSLVTMIGDNGRGTFLVRISELTGAGVLPPELKPFATREAVAVGRMRNADAHPTDGDRILIDALRELGHSRLTQAAIREKSAVLENAVRAVANSLSKLLATPALTTLVTGWIKPGLD